LIIFGKNSSKESRLERAGCNLEGYTEMINVVTGQAPIQSRRRD
jgi:hypothetical protein